MNAFRGFRQIALKELLHIRRDATTLFFALLIPIIQLSLFGFAIDFDVRHIRTAVVDLDRSRESREYIASLHNTEYLDMVETLPTPERAEDAVRRNEVRVAVVIPPDFARRYGTDSPPMVHVLLDGSDSQVANPARNAFQRPPDLSGKNAVDVRPNVLFNPQIRTQVYTIPGLIGVILQMVTVSLTSFSLVREREQGTLEQLMVSPVGRFGLMLGKLAPYSVLAMIEMCGVLFFAHLIFNIQVAGSLLLLLVLSVPFVLAALSMGLLISTIARNQAQALQMTMLTMLPSILLSGYIAPRETFPTALYYISNIFPVTYYMQIIRGIMVRGAGLFDLMPSVLALLLMMAILLTLATNSFHKSVA